MSPIRIRRATTVTLVADNDEPFSSGDESGPLSVSWPPVGEQTDEMVRAAFPLRFGLTEGKVAIVTGAGRGIGASIATLFAAEGAAVVVCDRDIDSARAVVHAIQSRGGECVPVAADVTKEDEVAAAMSTAIDRYGRLDCAVNNAGISGRFGSFIDLPIEEWQQMITTNLTSVFLCLKYELGIMAAQGFGAIVNISSGAGVIAAPGLPHYTAAKHGVLGLTKCAAQEFAAKGVRVNAILPGTTRTPVIESFINGDPDIEKMVSRNIGRGSLGEPEEVAEAAVWLCSDRASFVSGESLLVDGATICR
jgi:NAD(P)-dependent dehydrogenase (short-subunit alcohol dehydrogenase family)